MLTLAQPTAATVKAKLFRGFSDPTRLAILETLREGPLSVGEIVNTTALTQSNVSNHLSCLKDCGLVVSEKRGRYVHYGPQRRSRRFKTVYSSGAPRTGGRVVGSAVMNFSKHDRDKLTLPLEIRVSPVA